MSESAVVIIDSPIRRKVACITTDVTVQGKLKSKKTGKSGKFLLK